jgi:hypothetical protein
MAEFNCLPMCSLCTKPGGAAKTPFKKCGTCKARTYCDRKCQIIDWKHGNHKGCRGTTKEMIHKNPSHQPWCAYLDRDPELDEGCIVGTNEIKSNPREVITVGMNTCIFVVVKTTREVVGWHASMKSNLAFVRKKLKAVSASEFVSGFIIPGEDRKEGTLDLKPTCRTILQMPWTDPTHSRRVILEFLKTFEWYQSLEVMPPIKSYKDFVVFDMVHERPYTFSDVAQFDQGCSFDGAVDSACSMP